MDKNDHPKFYDQINEDDLPPLITTRQSTFNYNELLESFMPQAAIFATPVSYCFPSSSIVITKDPVESHNDVPKPKEEEVVAENVVEPPPPGEPVTAKEMDKAQSSEETIVDILDDSETESDTEIAKKEVSGEAGSLAIVQVNDHKGLLLLEGPKVSEQGKPTLIRKKRARVYPDWLLENFIIEARPRVNGKTVDKYYYHRVTKVKCRSTIEAEEYLRHGINPKESKKRKRMETQRVVVKFLRESYENLLRWYEKRDKLQTLFDDMMKNAEQEKKSEDKGKDILVENNDELEKGEKKNTEEEGEAPEDPKAKKKGIPMEGTEVVIIDDDDDDDDEPVPMEVTLGVAGSVSLEEKNLVEIPIGWFF